jgi:hypothetical protein
VVSSSQLLRAGLQALAAWIDAVPMPALAVVKPLADDWVVMVTSGPRALRLEEWCARTSTLFFSQSSAKGEWVLVS